MVQRLGHQAFYRSDRGHSLPSKLTLSPQRHCINDRRHVAADKETPFLTCTQRTMRRMRKRLIPVHSQLVPHKPWKCFLLDGSHLHLALMKYATIMKIVAPQVPVHIPPPALCSPIPVLSWPQTQRQILACTSLMS